MTNAAGAISEETIDQLVGLSIRQRRKSRGLSQAQLGEALGVSFQQIQKYERGANRVSASMLWKVARALHCEIADLFENAPAPNGGRPPPEDPEGLGRIGRAFLATTGGLSLARAYLAMPDPFRRAVVAAAHAFAEAKT
jgi:transcriptional regulator with XRE-family HTH domain